MVFPHRLGAPYKRALRHLMADHLKKIIQDNGKEMKKKKDCYFMVSDSWGQMARSCWSVFTVRSEGLLPWSRLS